MDDLEDSTFERDLSPVARLLAAHDFPDPPEVFLQRLCGCINRKDIGKIKVSQEHMLQRFEKTNEMLLNFNALSAGRYEATAKDFKRHTLLLESMKNDLSDVFKRIRALKTQLSKQHPDAFTVHGQVASVLEEEEEEEEEEDDDTLSEDLVAPSSSNTTQHTNNRLDKQNKDKQNEKIQSDKHPPRDIPSIVEPTSSLLDT